MSPRRAARATGADAVADVDDAGCEDVSAEATSVDHRPQQGGACEALEVRARFAPTGVASARRPFAVVRSSLGSEQLVARKVTQARATPSQGPGSAGRDGPKPRSPA